MARLLDVIRHLSLFLLLGIPTLFAQRPPVVLVDGYHLTCDSGDLLPTHDFGELPQRLQAEGVSVSFLATCSFPGKPPIEELGNALGDTIRKLNAPQVDVISHSMGGLIVRSYLAGKQTAPGVFTPPADPKIRKWVSIATPNFGALLPSIVGGYLPDLQSRELTPGSQFLFDLATWNQNHDDLRGIDVVGLAGSAGGFGPISSASDGTVALTSASMSFAEPDERTRILPYCHGSGDLTALLGLGCDAPPIAKLQADNQLSWQIIDSFLNGTDAWRTIGHSPSQDKFLSRYGGVLSQQRDRMGAPTGSIQDTNSTANAPQPGGYTVVLSKPGPKIALVGPSAARLSSLSLAPRMLISIYGNNLSGATVSVNGQTLVLNYSGDNQMNALLPENVTGLAKLSVTNSQGMDTVNIFVESAVPAVFTRDGSGSGAAAYIRTGDYVSLYVTGLGKGGGAVTVTFNGASVPVTYAGPAPGFPGLDQINVLLPSGSGTLQVQAGRNFSNTVRL